MTNIKAYKQRLEELKEITEHQANMQSLWSRPIGRHLTISEYTLMAALRHLHAVIDGDLDIADDAKKQYWDLESEL